MGQPETDLLHISLKALFSGKIISIKVDTFKMIHPTTQKHMLPHMSNLIFLRFLLVKNKLIPGVKALSKPDTNSP